MASTILVIQHEDDGPPSWVGQWLNASGVALKVLYPFRGDKIPAAAPPHIAGLLVMGGSMGANDDAVHPWLGDERALMAHCVENDMPVLGICLGGQMLATAIGGVVTRAPVSELGVYAFDVHGAAAGDPLFGPLARTKVVAGQWHQDYIAALPEHATVLAGNANCPVQAFRVGQNAYGVQFHPEIDRALFSDWVDGAIEVVEESGRGMEEVKVEVGSAQAQLHATWKPIVQSWARRVHSYRGS
ncbi:MAG: type 1 glutamine amidotransferase [Burkholderiaceae bacterium]